jgi:hypothetical protein
MVLIGVGSVSASISDEEITRRGKYGEQMKQEGDERWKCVI